VRTDETERLGEERETGRLEAFSDGVIAVAITLLVLDIKVPRASDLGGASLLYVLAHQWPVYLAYLTSFATILVMWLNHHNLFKQITRADHTLLLLNGLLLLAITLVPFPTALMAEYIREPQARTAAVVYAGSFVLIALFFNALWRYAAHDGRLLVPTADRQFVADINRQFRIGPILYVIAVGLALISAVVCFTYVTVIASSRSSGPYRRMEVLEPAITGGMTDERRRDCTDLCGH